MTNKSQHKGADPDALSKEVLSVAKHSGIYLVGQALSRATGFFMIPIYTRFIAPTNYGAMELIEILVSAIAMTVSMRISHSMSRFYYGEKDEVKRNLVVSTATIGLAVVGLPVVIGFIALSRFISAMIFEDPLYQYYFQIAIAAVWFGTLCEIGYAYLRMRYMAKSFVIITTLQLIFALSLNIWFVVFLRLDILGVFYSTLIVQGLTGLLLACTMLKIVRPHVSIPLLFRMIGFGLPLVPARLGSMLGFVSNRFFLLWFASPDPTIALTQIGLFSLGHKFGIVINRLVNVPFNSFWGPRRLDLLLSGTPGAKETTARICTYATMISIYLSLILSAGIESIVEIMADPAYKGAHVVVPFVALAYIALGLEMHFTTGILYSRKTIWATYIGILTLGVILIWNYIFVPKYGLLGAATSNLAGFTVRLILIYIVSQRLFAIPFELGRLITMFVTAVALYTVSQGVTFSSPYVTLLIRTGFVALFPVVLFVVGFYKEGELEFVRHYLRNGLRFANSVFLRFWQIL